jgi:hypothetical protein
VPRYLSFLSLWVVTDPKRPVIEREVRRSAAELEHPRYGKAVIRNQNPKYKRKLRKALTDCTPQERCQLLNRKVFFWLSEERLGGHMAARENRGKRHLVLTIDSYRLTTTCEGKNIVRPEFGQRDSVYAIERHSLLMPMRDYPFAEPLARGPYYTLVEVALDVAAPDILNFVTSADYMRMK